MVLSLRAPYHSPPTITDLHLWPHYTLINQRVQDTVVHDPRLAQANFAYRGFQPSSSWPYGVPSTSHHTNGMTMLHQATAYGAIPSNSSQVAAPLHHDGLPTVLLHPAHLVPQEHHIVTTVYGTHSTIPAPTPPDVAPCALPFSYDPPTSPSTTPTPTPISPSPTTSLPSEFFDDMRNLINHMSNELKELKATATTNFTKLSNEIESQTKEIEFQIESRTKEIEFQISTTLQSQANVLQSQNVKLHQHMQEEIHIQEFEGILPAVCFLFLTEEIDDILFDIRKLFEQSTLSGESLPVIENPCDEFLAKSVNEDHIILLADPVILLAARALWNENQDGIKEAMVDVLISPRLIRAEFKIDFVALVMMLLFTFQGAQTKTIWRFQPRGRGWVRRGVG